MDLKSSLVSFLDEAFSGPAWHGPALMTALRGVAPAAAEWRPGPDRHSIRDVVLHAAYWKHVVTGRLTRTRERFPIRGRNWFVETRGTFNDDVAVLEKAHEQLRQAVELLPTRALSRTIHGRQTAAENIRGIAAHDVYHAAQIQLLKKLAQRTNAGTRRPQIP